MVKDNSQVLKGRSLRSLNRVAPGHIMSIAFESLYEIYKDLLDVSLFGEKTISNTHITDSGVLTGIQ